jgi:hypothetical protein
MNSLDLIATKLHLIGRPADAEGYLREAVREKERCLGEEDKRAKRSRLALGRALVAHGRWKDAEGEMRKAIVCFREGETEGLQILHELAEILSKQEGRGKESETMARKAVQGREKVVGVKAQVTLESVWLLGQVCEKLGKKGEARSL